MSAIEYKTAESVSPKHPDKLCDRVSDTILDAYLAGDSMSRVAVESAGGHGKLFIFGEVTSKASVDVEKAARTIVGSDIDIEIRLVEQSPEIAQGVDTGGAGDQGIMVGYACSDTAQLLPTETVAARELNQYLYKTWQFDGKTQVTLRGDQIESVVASFQNAAGSELRDAVTQWLTAQGLANFSSDTKLHINPAGDWHVGGFDADTGLTGRKLVVDNYGPRIPIGGGCFSGKDASKVDRSAAYMARKIARDYLAAENATEVYCYLAYAIGYEQPLESIVIIDGKQQKIEGYELTPAGIIDTLNLRKPQFAKTAEYGHFGYGEFAWEK